MRDLLRRIVRLEAPPDLPTSFSDDDNGPPKLIRIKGGLPDTLHATIGEQRLDAMHGEALEDFSVRALDIAAEIGAPFVVISGLP